MLLIVWRLLGHVDVWVLAKATVVDELVGAVDDVETKVGEKFVGGFEVLVLVVREEEAVEVDPGDGVPVGGHLVSVRVWLWMCVCICWAGNLDGCS